MRRESPQKREPEPSAPSPADAVRIPGGQRGVLAAVRDFRQRGQSCVLCLVVRTNGSTYRKAGALAAVVSADGTQRGVISGGCLESDLAVAARGVLGAGTPDLLVFDTRSDDDLLFGSGSGCRGHTSVLLVPVINGTSSPLGDALERADDDGIPVKLGVALEGPHRANGWCWLGSEARPLGAGPPELLPLREQPNGAHRVTLSGDDTPCAVITIRPAPRVTLVGAGPELPPLIRIGREMGWHLTVIDHRAAAVREYADQADLSIVERPGNGLARLAGQSDGAVVVMTHTAANDLEALRALSLRPEQYIGLLGPPARRDELIRQLDPAHREALTGRLRSPVGIKLGGDGPEVLALSIAAELQQFFMTRGMSPGAPRLGVVVLAAGASRRLGRSKQLLVVDGESLVRRVTRAALSVLPARAVVVVGADADRTFREVADLGVERVDSAGWAHGMGASLSSGARSLGTDVDGLLVVLCDQTGLSAPYLRQLVSAWVRAPDNAVASGYARTVGVPAILPRSWFPDLVALDADHGARDLLRSRADRVTVIAAPELARDIDEPADLAGDPGSPES